MMNWIRQHILIAGIALIVITNAIVLAGVMYNRSGTPESMLRMSQRELQLPYFSEFGKDNSGMSLMISWRIADSRNGQINANYFGGNPEWLDKAKLFSLGFDVSTSVDTEQGRRHSRNQSARQVFLVMELNGQAYQHALQYAMQKALSKPSKETADNLEEETSTRSRLFVVDAGLNREALRAKYPDSATYAIVRGLLRPAVLMENGKASLGGYVSGISAESINVPLEFRKVFEPMQQSRHSYIAPGDKNYPYAVTIAFGKRLEPWIVNASKPKK